ncbi:MAG: outer membrane protein transport protein [Verrucomicrobiota bacterium]
MNSLRSGLIGYALLTTFGTSVWALGFRNPDQDAAATAQGEAFVAQADNASAIYYNPAGLTQIKGTQSRGGGYVTFRDIKFNGTAANESLNDPAYTFNQYLCSDLGTEKLRVGASFNVPFGNGSDWGNNTTFKYQITKSSLQVRAYSGAVAYQITEQFSLGAVFNLYDGKTELERLVSFAPFPVPDGRFRFDGGGQAIGATAGLMYRINDKNTVGLTYRSPFAINFDGSAVVKKDPIGAYGNSPAHARIEFPQSVAIGYAFRPTPKLKLEVDIEWTDWDTLNTSQLHSPNPAFNSGPGTAIAFNWENSFYYEAGAEYKIDDHWTARAGYIFSQNSVPNSTFSPTLPDSNRHVFSVGVGYTGKRFGIDLTYQYSLSDDRTVTGSQDANADGTGDFDGKWKSSGQALMVSSTLRF